MNAKCKTKSYGAMRMADGGQVSPWSIKGVYNRLTTPPPATTLTPVTPTATPPVTPPVAASPPTQSVAKPQSAISQYAGMTALQRREKEAGLKDGGQLKTGHGGAVPGNGKGDKIAAKYEPGEFVVSNDMMKMEPGLQEHLHMLRNKTLAHQGKTPAMAEAGRFKKGAIRALSGLDPKEDAYGYLPNESVGDRLIRRFMPTGGAPFELGAPNLQGMPAKDAGAGRGFINPAMVAPDATQIQPASLPATVPAPIPAPLQTDVQRGGGTVPAGAVAPITPITPVAPAAASTGQVNVSRQPNGVPSFIGQDVAGPVTYSGADKAGFKPSGFGVSTPGAPGDGRRVMEMNQRMTADILAEREAAQAQREKEKMTDLAYSPLGTPGRAFAQKQLGLVTQENTTRRGQDINATNQGAIQKLSQQRFGLDQNKDARDATLSGLDAQSKTAILNAQKALQAAKTPAEKVAAEDNLRALQGKYGKEAPPDQYAYAPGGQTIDPVTGQTITQPGVIFNKATGQQVQQQGQAQAKPAPVAGEVRNGYKFKGGNVNDKTNWVKV